MPRGRRKSTRTPPEEIKRDPHEILHNLIQEARNLTDKDIWNHSLGGKKKNKHKIRATEQEEDEELLHEADLSSTKYFHLSSQPSIICNGELRDYQIEGVSWLINLRNNGLHGILADEMGLGKTLQCITLLAYLKQYENISGIHLIIVPKSTIINWCREFKKWCPSFNVFALEAANKEERKQLIRENFKPKPSMDIIICSYEICMIEKAILKKINYEYIVVDEAHRLKNNASKFSTILRTEFKSLNRLLITGTPLQNNLRELWSLLNFLLPNLFKNVLDFDAMFDFGNSDNEQKKIFQQLRILLAPFLLRRLKINVTNLPPKTELIIFVGMTELQKDVYKKILLRDLNTLTGDAGSKRALLNLVMQLRKCSNHPYLFDGVEDMSLDPFGEHLINNCGKLLLLDKLLKRLYNNGSRILIFSQMTRVLDILEDYCQITKYKYCRIDGSTSGEDRQIQMDDFNSNGSDKFLFLLTTRAGGLGINLQSADIVIIYDSDWNPQMDLQAMDRAHRIGQTKPVFVYRLVTKDSVEQRILERAELKLRLDAMVIQKHRKNNSKNNNNRDDLMDMIQYGADKIFSSKGATVTDEDIDVILNVAKMDTEKLKGQFLEKTKKEFSELTLEFNYQEYDGLDYTERRKERQKIINQERYKLIEKMNQELGGSRSTRLATQFGVIGKRKNYNEDAYYRAKLEQAREAIRENKNINTKNKNGLKMPKRLPDTRYWQLYDVKRLFELNVKEWNWFQKYKNAYYYNVEKHGIIGLSDEEICEKKEILDSGFNMIGYRDFGCFVRGCIKYGKDNIENICKDMMEIMEIENNEIIKKYHKVFFEKCDEIEELENAVERIEEAEDKKKLRLEREKERKEKRIAEAERKKKLRLEREKERDERMKMKIEKKEAWIKYKQEMAEKRDIKRKEISERYEKRLKEAERKRKEKFEIMEQRMKEQEERYKMILDRRMSKYEMYNDNIYKELQIPDAKGNEYGFNKEMDKYLFLITYKIGYGNWNEIYKNIIKHPIFRFNFLLQTLKPIGLKNRCDMIIRACNSSNKSNKSSKRNLVSDEKKKENNKENINGGNNNGQEPPNKKRKLNEI